MDQVVIASDNDVEVISAEPEAQIIVLDATEEEVVFVGDAGIQGVKGDPGVDGDKYFQQPFSGTDTVNITHNLGKYPAVTVFDTAGDEVEGSVRHTDINNLTVTFSAFTSGIVTCN